MVPADPAFFQVIARRAGSRVLERIVPAGVAVAEVFGYGDDDGKIFPAELAAVAAAVPKRRGEFTAARVCAHRALELAGLPAVPIVPGPSREPLWPDGVVGILTHCDGYRACAVGRSGVVAAIGIDAEPHAVLPEGVLAMVTSETERAALAGLAAADPATCWDRILFCAKESVYKAWFPATGRWLGFLDAEVTIDPAGCFTARLAVPGPAIGGQPLTAYHGRWLVGSGLILTSVTVGQREQR